MRQWEERANEKWWKNWKDEQDRRTQRGMLQDWEATNTIDNNHNILDEVAKMREHRRQVVERISNEEARERAELELQAALPRIRQRREEREKLWQQEQGAETTDRLNLEEEWDEGLSNIFAWARAERDDIEGYNSEGEQTRAGDETPPPLQDGQPGL